jgi:multicomponent Na+:H+ antiporter subunit E
MGLLLHWFSLFCFWILLSGLLDAKHLGIGLVATIAVALLGRKMAVIGTLHDGAEKKAIHLGRIPWPSIALYSVWLLRAIAAANWQVARIVLDPRLPIDPGLVRIPTRVRSDVGITLLANSITITPGTITVEAAEDDKPELIVHALVQGDNVRSDVHAMEDRVIGALGQLENGA